MAARTAYADESARPGRYCMAVVVVEDDQLGELRRVLRGQLIGAQRRLHLHAEQPRRRRQLLTTIAGLRFEALGWTVRSGPGLSEHAARAACLTAIVTELQQRGIPRLIIESRQDDRDDTRTIHRTRARQPTLTFAHQPAASEPALWLADAVSWALSAGRPWTDILTNKLTAQLITP